jgi:hypothetical protein
LDLLFETEADEEKAWEVYTIKQPHAACMRINQQMKREFEAWLAECARSKTQKTDPVYNNACGYSYTF